MHSFNVANKSISHETTVHRKMMAWIYSHFHVNSKLSLFKKKKKNGVYFCPFFHSFFLWNINIVDLFIRCHLLKNEQRILNLSFIFFSRYPNDILLRFSLCILALEFRYPLYRFLYCCINFSRNLFELWSAEKNTNCLCIDGCLEKIIMSTRHHACLPFFIWILHSITFVCVV